ncbi:MAG: hypothetical protein IKZ87_03155, partial [Actinomycetaceae bacterium]|nr:hypothetical protein [Actinomycetaceae bacterium]
MSEEALRSTEMMMRLATPMFRGATQGIGGLATAGVLGTLGITWLAGKAISAPFKAIASLVRYANEHPELLEKRGEITMKKLVSQETTGIHTTRLLESKELEALKTKLEYYGVAFSVEKAEHGAYIHLEAKDLPRLEHALETVQPEIIRMEIKEVDTHITDLAATIQAEEKVISELDKDIAYRTEETGLSSEVKELRAERTERQERIDEMKAERNELVKEKAELENSLKEQLKQERVVEPPTQEKELGETIEKAQETPKNTQEMLSENEVETQETVVSETVSTSNDVPEPTQDITLDGNLTGQDVPTQHAPGTQ